MKSSVIIILSAVAFIAGFLIFYQSRPVQQNPSANNQTGQQENTEKWETKTDDQASVTVVVTPVDLSLQSAQWKFDIDMSTHSVELDQDMTKIAVLIDDQGKEYKPLTWSGPVGGHHREGILQFASISPQPKSITLKIFQVGGVSERNFNWQLK